jgi:hypothetical protein
VFRVRMSKPHRELCFLAQVRCVLLTCNLYATNLSALGERGRECAGHHRCVQAASSVLIWHSYGTYAPPQMTSVPKIFDNWHCKRQVTRFMPSMREWEWSHVEPPRKVQCCRRRPDVLVVLSTLGSACPTLTCKMVRPGMHTIAQDYAV